MFQTGIFTDIFKLTATSINKKIETGELHKIIAKLVSIEDKVLIEKGKKEETKLSRQNSDSSDRTVELRDTPIVEEGVFINNLEGEKTKPVWMDDDFYQNVYNNPSSKTFFQNKVHKILNKQIGNIWEV